MNEISFSEKEGKWYAEFVSDGTEFIQIERVRMGDLLIMKSIGDMTPVRHSEFKDYAGAANMMFELDAPKGAKIEMWSNSEVKKCRSLSIPEAAGGSVPQASNDTLGGIKTGYTTSGKNYAVAVDGDGKAFVNVPWSDANTTYNKASDSTLGLVKIGYSSNEKNYAVQLDGDGKMYVSVPWTDTNTTYVAATSAQLGLVKQGVAVADASGDAEAKLNALLASLRTAGVIAV